MRKDPGARVVAEAIAKHGTNLARSNPEVRVSGTKVLLDSTAIDVLRGIGEGPAQKDRRTFGTTTVYSKVIRVGRAQEGNAMEARIELSGRYRDVPIDGASVDSFLEAFKTGELQRIGLRAQWVVSGSGHTELEMASVRAISLETFTPISGRELMESVQLDEDNARAFIEENGLDS